jgi:hypothetical protein
VGCRKDLCIWSGSWLCWDRYDPLCLFVNRSKSPNRCFSGAWPGFSILLGSLICWKKRLLKSTDELSTQSYESWKTTGQLSILSPITYFSAQKSSHAFPFSSRLQNRLFPNFSPQGTTST